MAAASARAFIISRVADLSPASLTSPLTHRIRSQLPTLSKRRSDASSVSVSCCLSGGVSDEFVSTRKSSFDRGFSVIANMLKRIEPLDNSVISKGVSDSAKDSMKQTISTMLGLLPSDQFSVTVRVSKHPLYRLLFSSIITGYTLWNAEYRISLMRNFDISSNSSKNMDLLEGDKLLDLKGENSKDCDVPYGMSLGDMERIRVFGDLSPDAVNYIQQLQIELDTVKKDLDAQKQENKRIEFGRESRNNLLDYLRSLDPDMVNELSQPASPEVEEIMQQLVQNVVRRFFKSETTTDLKLEFPMGDSGSCGDDSEDEAGTSRDYLAKLLFWCMLLGHHLRGLENRLHLTCAVGLL